MNGQTHVKIALATALGVGFTEPSALSLVSAETYEMIPLLAGAVIGGLIPDIDIKSTLGKYFPITNKIVTGLADKGVRAFYHRHLTHSLLFFPLMLFLALRYIPLSTNNTVFLFGMLLGVLSHIIADIIIGKVWFLYPIITKPVSILNVGGKEHPDRYEKVDRFFGNTAYLACVIMVVLRWLINNNLITI